MAKQAQRLSRAKNQPEKKFGRYPGGIAIVIWRNQVETEDGAATCVPSRSSHVGTSIRSQAIGWIPTHSERRTFRP